MHAADQIHHIFFSPHGRMHINIHCDLDTAVSQDFAEAFHITPQFHTSACERVTKQMKMKWLNLTFFQNGRKAVLQVRMSTQSLFLPEIRYCSGDF